MSVDKPFTKENLDSYLKELAKEFRKKNGTRMLAEIILIGGASIPIRQNWWNIQSIIRLLQMFYRLEQYQLNILWQ